MNDLYLDSDGTLGISADVDISKVRRILLTQEGTHYGSMYYLDDSDHIAEVSKKVDSDLISRQAAIDIVEFECGEWSRLAKTIAEEIKQLPSAQPEIIHCWECKYSDENWRRVSFKWLPCMNIQVPSNWFCGSAERREE